MSQEATPSCRQPQQQVLYPMFQSNHLYAQLIQLVLSLLLPRFTLLVCEHSLSAVFMTSPLSNNFARCLFIQNKAGPKRVMRPKNRQNHSVCCCGKATRRAARANPRSATPGIQQRAVSLRFDHSLPPADSMPC